MANMNRLNGRSIYDKIFKLLDYNGEIVKSDDIVGYTYTDNFSPNNIKRLIISPDGVIMVYHTPIPNGSRQQRIVLNPVEVQVAENLPDYKPMMNILSTNRICASIEEVIFLVQSRNSNISLSSNELAFENLAKGYANRSADLLATVSNRYKRLYAFTIAQMNIDAFMFYMKQAGNNYEFISDLPFMESSQKQYVHKDDWYESWGSAAKTYPMDAVGGKLHTHFSAIRDKKLSENRKKAIDANKSEANKELVAEVEKLYERYNKIIKIRTKLTKIVNDFGYNSICFVKLENYQLVPLYSCSVVSDKYPNLQEATSETEALKHNIEALNRGISDCIGFMARNLIKAVNELCVKMPITAKTLLKIADEYTVIVPNDVEALNENILKVTGKCFDGKNLLDSYVNSCWLYVSFFLNRSKEGFRNDLITKEYWKGAIK